MSENRNKKTCFYCKFWDCTQAEERYGSITPDPGCEEGDYDGRCKRFPPVYIGEAGTSCDHMSLMFEKGKRALQRPGEDRGRPRWQQPTTYGDEDCWEWSPK